MLLEFLVLGITNITDLSHIVDITHIAFAILMKISLSLYSICRDRHLVFEPSEKFLIAPCIRYNSSTWYMSSTRVKLIL